MVFFVDGVGLSGGLHMFWTNDTDASFLGYSSGHIDVSISLYNLLVFILLVFMVILS